MIITNIQRMCFHDGPGIRTTVFFKGCSIHCPWCANPENISPQIENYYNDGVSGIFGKEITPFDLYKELIKDKTYWESGGGVTLSGGEAMLQTDDVIELTKLLKNDGINVVVETSLYIPPLKLGKIKGLIDGFIVDVKILDKEKSKDILGGNIHEYFENVGMLYSENKISSFRFPLCKEFTSTTENINLAIGFLKNYKNIPTQLFSVHTLGEGKYKALNRRMPGVVQINEDELEAIRNRFVENGMIAEIISI